MMQAALRGITRYMLKPMLGGGVPIPRQRRLLNMTARLRILPRGVHCESVELGVVTTQKLVPGGVSQDAGAIVFFHGGAYCVGSPESHRNLTARLARDTGCTVYAPDYRMAPEHPYPAAVNDAEAVWQTLLDSGLEPAQIVLAGDSAGGGLALALALRLRDAGKPLPVAMYLISPWTDLTLSGGTIRDNADIDPLISVDWIRVCAQLYVGTTPAADPGVSPLFAECAGLSPIRIDTGSDEVLLDDTRRFCERARAAGVEVEMDIHEALWHDYVLFAGMMAAATQTLADAGRWISGKLDLPA